MLNAGAAVSFSPGANYFRRRREPESGTTSGAKDGTRLARFVL
jgi:hypothetical protein